MAIVNCPECSKKLKVADTSVGKKVKCSCGTVFVAEQPDAPPLAAASPSPSVTEKVLVACTECASKLKVAATSLGKKMKCPKCASIFVASLPATALAEEAMQPHKSKPAPVDDEEESLNFAAANAQEEDQLEEDEELPKPKPKSRKMQVDEDEEEAAPQPAGKPVYPSRLLVNLFVVFLVLAYGAFFAITYPGFGQPPLLDLGLVKQRTMQPIQLPGEVPPVGKPQPKPGPIAVPKGKARKDPGKKEEVKKDDAKKDDDKKDDSKKDDAKKDDGKKDEPKDEKQSFMRERQRDPNPACSLHVVLTIPERKRRDMGVARNYLAQLPAQLLPIV